MIQNTPLALLQKKTLTFELIPPVKWKESGEKWTSMKKVGEVIEKNPLDKQVGGSHYKKYKIQPVEYAMANDLNYCQANAIKYITRYRDKGGIEDLNKAIHNIEILIELERKENDGQGYQQLQR